ncbi:MAG TPA: carboxypeptidase-like regulatory domain-containing protein, partial [Pyrinomonadaceae bacterium]|nr:carboxypeptidase-like regulatory domain-containing protein [Pyrinomonadaceae bacterium]
MRRFFSPIVKTTFSVLFLLLNFIPTFAQQSQATLRGQVIDALGGIVIGVTVTAADAGGTERTATTDEQGQYVFPALAPGRYAIRVNTPGFSPYENAEVEITAGRTEPLDVVLSVANALEEVTVTDDNPIGTEPENNADATVLRGDDLDSLPDDPEDLAEALQALAGPSAGVDDEGQLYIDGF